MMDTEEIGREGAQGAETGGRLHFQMPRTYSDPRPPQDVTRPHEHWCAVCGIGLGGDV